MIYRKIKKGQGNIAAFYVLNESGYSYWLEDGLFINANECIYFQSDTIDELTHYESLPITIAYHKSDLPDYVIDVIDAIDANEGPYVSKGPHWVDTKYLSYIESTNGMWFSPTFSTEFTILLSSFSSRIKLFIVLIDKTDNKIVAATKYSEEAVYLPSDFNYDHEFETAIVLGNTTEESLVGKDMPVDGLYENCYPVPVPVKPY